MSTVICGCREQVSPTEQLSEDNVAGGQLNHAPPFSPLGRWALYYCSNGMPVLPCQPGDKRPLGALVPHGLRDASNDPQRIEHWWRQCPTANIGLRTGDGVFVLDIDGPEGAKSLVALQDEHGKLPDTVVSATGSGGHHLFYRARPGKAVPNSASKLGPKLDVRGDGGYVIAPPSVHPNGTPYAFLPGSEPWFMQVAPAPDWLSDLVVARPVARVIRPIILPAMDSQRDAYVRGALRRAVMHIAQAPEGCRNNTLNTEAISLARFVLGGALSFVELTAALMTAALAVGLGQREAERTIASALGAGLSGQEG